MPQISLMSAIDSDALHEFTVDISQIEVNITTTVNDGILFGKMSKFQVGDNINLLGFGVGIPHGFMAGSVKPIVLIRAKTPSLNVVIYDDIRLPNFQMEYDFPKPININLETLQGSPPEELEIQVQMTQTPTVSMLNVPSLIDAQVIPVLPFIKVEHNFRLES